MTNSKTPAIYRVVSDTDGKADVLETVAQKNVPCRLNVGVRVGQKYRSLFLTSRECLLASGRPKPIVLHTYMSSHSTLHAVCSATHMKYVLPLRVKKLANLQRGRLFVAYHLIRCPSVRIWENQQCVLPRK